MKIGKQHVQWFHLLVSAIHQDQCLSVIRKVSAAGHCVLVKLYLPLQGIQRTPLFVFNMGACFGTAGVVNFVLACGVGGYP